MQLQRDEVENISELRSNSKMEFLKHFEALGEWREEVEPPPSEYFERRPIYYHHFLSVSLTKEGMIVTNVSQGEPLTWHNYAPSLALEEGLKSCALLIEWSKPSVMVNSSIFHLGFGVGVLTSLGRIIRRFHTFHSLNLVLATKS